MARLSLNRCGGMLEPASDPSVSCDGKFLNRFGQKFFFKALRLTHSPEDRGLESIVRLRARLEAFAEGHTTGLIVEATQPEQILELAAQLGMAVMVELAVPIEALLNRRETRTAIANLEKAVSPLSGNAALAGYLIDCPVSRDVLKFLGIARARNALRGMNAVIRRRDPRRLIAIKHRPQTAALSLLEEDLIYSTVGGLSPIELKRTLVDLHNLAESRPVVIEFDRPMPDQDDLVACAFGFGAAGVVAEPIRPLRRPHLLEVRPLRADELLPFVTLNGSCPPQPRQAPMVSVVICAYNAERTMRACLDSLRKLDYPHYEVVIVDDGSRDRTAEISMDFPEFRLIRQPNKGLSAARNVGMHAACGEIIAYTDSDCVVDPHWLTLVVRAMSEGAFDGCGGPNYGPHEEHRAGACCAASPGAPSHILTASDRAEHLAGCNMVFTKAALLKLGGFDPQFTSAGDDVDICWRVLEAGMRLGYCPAAFVWHFRRNTIRAYFGQQRGYGRAESMLYAKYPDRFNALGQIKWQGTIPGLTRTVPGGTRRKVWWCAPATQAQPAIEPPLTVMRVLPQTLEWNLAAIVVLIASVAAGRTAIPALALLALGPVWALYYAWHAPLEKRHNSFGSRALIAALAFSGPLVRSWTRYKSRLQAAWSAQLPFASPARQRPVMDWFRRSLKLSYWNESWSTRDRLLERLAQTFRHARHPVIADSGWRDFDLEIRPDPWTRVELKTADEEHEGAKIKSHVLARVRLSAFSKFVLLTTSMSAAIGAALAMPIVTLASLLIASIEGAFAMSELIESGRLAYRVIEQCADELGLIPLGKPTTAVRRKKRRTAPLPALDLARVASATTLAASNLSAE